MTTVNQGDKVNLVIPQGSTYRHALHYQYGGVAVDITGYTARMQFRETVDAESIMYEGTTENGHITVAGSAGDVTIEIPAATTSAWTFRSAVYDLEIVAPDGKVTRLIKGRVKIDPEVTR